MMAQMATETASREKVAKLIAAFNEGLDDACIEGILQTQEGNVNYVMPASKHLGSVDHTAHSGTVLHQLRRIDRGEISGILNLLIKYGADITIRNSEGQTVLHSEIVKVYKYESDWQPIIKDSIINWVLSAHVEHSVPQNPRDANGISHFDIALMYKHKQAINFFLENGVNVNQAISEDSRIFAGYTPLHFAAYHSCLDTMEKLLMCGADASSKNAQGLTALQMLIEKNLGIVGLRSNRSKRLLSEYKVTQTMVHLLLTSAGNNNNNSSRVEQYGSGFSSFHAACSLEDISLAANLLAHVEDVNGIIDIDATFRPGYSALHLAAHFSVDLVKLLLASGADILAEDASGVTPLDICLQAFSVLDTRSLLRSVLLPAVAKNALDDRAFQARLDNMLYAVLSQRTYQLSLDSKSDVNRPIGNDSPLWPGCTILHLAVLMSERARAVVSNKKPADHWQNSQLIEKCMQSGADCTLQDLRGSTPLHLAFYAQKRKSLRCLLNGHVKTIDPVDENHVSHLHVACSEGNYATVEKLVLNGADVNLPTLRAVALPRCGTTRVSRDADMDIRPDEYPIDRKLTRTTEVVGITINLAAGCTPLHMAVMFDDGKGRVDVAMPKLLLRNGANVNATNADGWSAVHTAMLQSHYTGIGKALFTHSTKLRERVVDDIGLSHLHVACYVGSLKGVRKLIKLGSDVNRTVKADLELAGHYCQGKCQLLCRNAYAGYTPLHFAIGRFTTKIASELLAAGASVSATSSHVVSPLFQALSSWLRWDKQFVDLFVAHLRGSEALQERLQEDTGMTLLHVFALTMDVEAIEELLDAGLVDVNAKIRSDSSMWPGCTALHMWAHGLARCRFKVRPRSALKLLLDAGADVTLPDARLDTPLHLLNSSHATAIDEHFLAESKMMLQSQKDFSVNPVNSAGFTHFHISCRVNDLQSAKEFLKFGVDVNQRVHDFFHGEMKGEELGCTPLHLVVGERSGNSTHQPNRMEMIDLLLENGAEPGASDVLGNTPLHGITKVRFQRLELVEKIIRAGGALDAVNVLGETPFSVLLKSYRVSAEEVEFFLQRGCRMNVYNPIDKTGLLALPVLYACSKKQGNDIYKLFIKNPEIENVDDLGRTAIHNVVSARARCGWVTASLYPEVIERLVKQGCDVNAQDETGKTPLHVAAQFKNKAGLIALLDTGGDLNIVDAKGWSVLDYALDCCQGDANKDSRYHIQWISEILMMQLKTMRLTRVSVHKRNHNHIIVELLKKFDMSFPTIERSKAQVEETKEISIGNSSSLRLYDFLSETGAVAAYSAMSRLERRAVDKFFTSKNKVLDDFDEVKGLLKLQYRKGVVRAGLITLAMDSLRRASGIPLPEICCNHVLSYLALSDIQNLVASTEN